jgi:hypothetical protein
MQQAVSNVYLTSPDQLSSDTQEYSRITAFLNRGALEWKAARSGKWKSLLITTNASYTSGASNMSLPSDYAMNQGQFNSSGYLTIGDIDYPLIKQENIDQYPSGTSYFYITGNAGSGYEAVFSQTFVSDGFIPLTYYTENLATDTSGVSKEKLTTGTDETKCDDPLFLVYYALAELFLADDQGSKFQVYQEARQQKLDQMISNEYVGDHGMNNGIEIIDDLMGYEPIGGIFDD